MEFAALLVIFCPLLSGIINGTLCFFGIKNNKISKQVAISAIIIAAISAVYIFSHFLTHKEIIHLVIANWIKLEAVTVNWSIYIDQLTAIMFFLITIVSSVVHIYSLGYMAEDSNLTKFLSYLALFTFAMLVLVAADNFLQLFFGWEGVGVCSYLLIGYYYKKDSANNAALKAFIINRISDCAFIIGIMMIISYAESLEFKTVFSLASDLRNMQISISGHQIIVLDSICLLLFIGCMGKSAQLGLHIWLPDAMEGPTPVSALIHAATMVTAGVFLLARCSFIFEYSPHILAFITMTGALTCLFAASIAITCKDIKKLIAYSTCSQLGYMFFACGVSAYQAGIFHLITHGFFKALLFLAAGNIIHATEEQDLFLMARFTDKLRIKLPVTYISFWIGSLALIGIFPFAGFYSKDLILESAWLAGRVNIYGNISYILGIIAAGLTAVYSTKIIILTFHKTINKADNEQDIENHIHAIPQIMNLPLLILATGAIFAGMIGYYLLHIDQHSNYFADSIFILTNNLTDTITELPSLIKLLPSIVGISGIITGVYIYRRDINYKIAAKIPDIYNLLKNKFYIDEIYLTAIAVPLHALGCLYNMGDKIIDRFGPGGLALSVNISSKEICRLQTGYIDHYSFYIIFAMVISITVFISKYLLKYLLLG